MVRARRFRLGGSRNEMTKPPRVPGRSCLLGSQLGTGRDDQVIGECCHDLPTSSEGVTGKLAHHVYISVDYIWRRLMW